MGKFSERLKKRLEQYTPEELKREFDKHKRYNKMGPTVNEYFKNTVETNSHN